ncbi:MAG: hypothetical protein V4615_08440 [Bacteroidota bacterium]
MKQIIIYLLAIFGLTSCNQEKTTEENKAVSRVAITTNHIPLPDKLPTTVLDCSTVEFKSAKQQADTLLWYFGKKRLADDEKFFCAFPNSFAGMQNVFGFDARSGLAPLGDNGIVIPYFAQLNSIPKEIYYNKYINICIDGIWQADNIREAFGFAGRLTNDTEAACFSLSKRTNQEIKSVFHFIFDGHHPKNEYNKEIYSSLLPRVIKQNIRLGKLLTESYSEVLSEDDGHGH